MDIKPFIIIIPPDFLSRCYIEKRASVNVQRFIYVYTRYSESLAEIDSAVIMEKIF